MLADEQVLNKRTLFNLFNKFRLTKHGMHHIAKPFSVTHNQADILMIKRLRTYLFLLCFLLFACKNSEPKETFLEIDPSENNSRIKQAVQQQEEWATEPLLIVNKLFRPDYLVTVQNTYNVLLVKDSSDYYTATISQEGEFEDVPFNGVKCIVNLKWNKSFWQLQRIRKAYKCKNGLNPNTYSKDSCR